MIWVELAMIGATWIGTAAFGWMFARELTR
jgi:hypothetical protein